jgi:hypothetical protein
MSRPLKIENKSILKPERKSNASDKPEWKLILKRKGIAVDVRFGEGVVELTRAVKEANSDYSGRNVQYELYLDGKLSKQGYL